jgi:hypothetical protein
MHPDDRARQWPAGYQARQPGRVWPHRRGEVARTWPSIRVGLIQGHGQQYWPRPGRIFAAARSHTFKQLAAAIDEAFAPGTARTRRSSPSPTAGACDPDPDWEIEGADAPAPWVPRARPRNSHAMPRRSHLSLAG